MDVNSILLICVVCLSFRLSSPFVVSGLNVIVSSLQCVDEVCEQRATRYGNEQSGVHPYCEMEIRRGRLRGDCEESANIHNVCPQQDDSSCRCYNQSCIDGVVEKYRQQLQLHRMTYTCLKETCHGDEHCHIHKEYNEIVSSCHGDMHTDHIMCVDHDSVTSSRGCYCSTAECVQRTDRQQLQLHRMTYTCLKETCHGDEHCHIHKEYNEIVSSCHGDMHTDHIMCVDHDSVTSSRGCYCSTAECVQRTALHCLGVNCQFTEGCRIDQYSGQFQASCYTLHSCHHWQDRDACIPHCPVPLIFGSGHEPCHCNSQYCADNIQVYKPTTSTPTTTDFVLRMYITYHLLFV
ncbi:uncharacterized protein LOC134706067 [Mytilus trossulus]|uniref:uncharacterized protein LOC134706067 n=1 Tax=Mytilus trossulus TaxID=6551 RepID=UPI0030047C99